MWIEFRVEIERADWEDFGYVDNIEMLWTHYEVLDYLDSQGYHRHQHIIEDTHNYTMIIKAVYEVEAEFLTYLLLRYPSMLKTRKNYEKVSIFEAKTINF